MKSLIFPLMLILVATAFAQTRPATAPSHKLWVNNLGGYMRQRPGNWIVARSVKPALTAGEAVEYAHEEAAKSMVPYVRHLYPPGTSVAVIEQDLRSSIRLDHLIDDEEITSTNHPYGTIWSAALLVNVSQPRLYGIYNRIQRANVAVKVRHARIGITSAVLILVILCLFLIVNATTRGFFRFRLALASVLLIASGIFAITHLVQ